MDIKQLRYFVRIMELGSFSKAAEALHMTQPALGLHVRSLENELEVQLFVRHSRGVEATSSARELLVHANRIIRDLEETKAKLQGQGGPVRGKVSVGIAPALDAAQAANFIELGAQEFPEIRISIVTALTPTLMDWARTGQVDLALAHHVDGAFADLDAETIVKEDILFITANDGGPYPAAIPFAEVVRHSLILPPQPNTLRSLIQSEAESCGFQLDIRFELETAAIILELAERGVASCVLARGALANNARQQRCRVQRIVDPAFSHDWSMVRSRKRPLSKAARQVASLIVRAFSKDHLPQPSSRAAAGTVT